MLHKYEGTSSDIHLGEGFLQDVPNALNTSSYLQECYHPAFQELSALQKDVQSFRESDDALDEKTS